MVAAIVTNDGLVASVGMLEVVAVSRCPDEWPMKVMTLQGDLLRMDWSPDEDDDDELWWDAWHPESSVLPVYRIRVAPPITNSSDEDEDDEDGMYGSGGECEDFEILESRECDGLVLAKPEKIRTIAVQAVLQIAADYGLPLSSITID